MYDDVDDDGDDDDDAHHNLFLITFLLWATLLAWTAADQEGETRSTIPKVFG